MYSGIRERVVCADGTTLSIQASSLHYSTPRDDAGPYTTVEVGFPDVPPPASWRPYQDNPEAEVGDVYGYLPWECLDEFFAIHGEPVRGDLPPRAA